MNVLLIIASLGLYSTCDRFRKQHCQMSPTIDRGRSDRDSNCGGVFNLRNGGRGSRSQDGSYSLPV